MTADTPDVSRTPRVAVTGLGIVCPGALGAGALWETAGRGESFVSGLDRFDAGSYRCRVAGQVREFQAADFVERHVINQTDRCTHMAIAACRMATDDAGLDLAGEDPRRVGMYFANVFGGMEFAEPELHAQTFLGPDRVSAYQAIAWFFAATQGQWSIATGIKGFGKSIVADRAGGQQALLLGALAIQQGHADVIYAGGFEAPLTPYAFRIHESLGWLSDARGLPAAAYRPFDARRSGLVLGEGAAILVLESLDHARARGARIYAELAGGAMNCDGRETEQRGATHLAACLRGALAASQVTAEQLDHVIAEGLAVRDWDYREAAAIAQVVDAGRGAATTVSVPKARHGHLLAAGGALDAAYASLMIAHDTYLDPVNLDRPDAGAGTDLTFARHVDGAQGPRAVLACGSGYGGVNAALVFTRCAEGDAWRPPAAERTPAYA